MLAPVLGFGVETWIGYRLRLCLDNSEYVLQFYKC